MSFQFNKSLYCAFRVVLRRRVTFSALRSWQRNLSAVSAKSGKFQENSKNVPCCISQNVIQHQSISTAIFLSDKKSIANKLQDLSTNVDKIAHELTSEIKSKHKIYKRDFTLFFDKICELKFAASKHVSLLMTCCTNLMPEVSPQERMELLESVWEKIGSFYTFSINDYNELLRCYKENKHKFNVNSYLELMQPILPNNQTYYNLIAAVCEVGDTNQAEEVLANMKAAKIPITEECFNSLIEGFGRSRDMNAAKHVLELMQAMRIKPSMNTQVSLLKASIYSESVMDLDIYITDLKNKSITITEEQGMMLINSLCDMNLKKFISQIYDLFPKDIWKKSDIPPAINAACVQLIHEGYPEIAYQVYSRFPAPVYGANEDHNLYFRKLLRECVKAVTPWDVLNYICTDLIMTERNLYSFEIVFEAALQLSNTTLTTSIMTEMRGKGRPIRIHYFWPMLVHSAKTLGENGIFEVISLMNTMQVTPDFETLVDYILPNVNTESSQTTVKKLKANGLPVSSALTPIIFTELRKKKLREASELCEIYPNKLDCEHLINPLCQAFYSTELYQPLFIFLDAFKDRPMNDKKDWLGWFLVVFLSTRRFTVDFEHLEKILQHLTNREVLVSKAAVEICMTLVVNAKLNIETKQRIRDVLGSMSRVDFNLEVDMFNQHIQHPKEMNVSQLEDHLIELESKNLNTRGVLRKLLQEYCRLGMTDKAKAIMKKCEKEQISFSAGMLASIVDIYTKCHDLENAEHFFYLLQKTAPNFAFDEHKLIDFATLLISNGKRHNALDLLEEYSRKNRVLGGLKIESNCWKLLDSVSRSKNPKETEKFFNTLSRIGFCQPSNIVLGPLIRCYLNSGDLFGAVDEFIQISNKYKKTPLKHDLLCRLLNLSSGISPESTEMIGGKTKQEISKKYISQMLECDRKVHGNASSQLSLIIGLADCGLKKQLRKYVLEPTVVLNQSLFIKQCERLGSENKIEALKIIADCLHGLRNIQVEAIYEIILNIHNFNSDCEEAISLWTRMQENNVKPSQKFVKVFSGLLRSHKYVLPPDLIGYLNVEDKIRALDS